jgi:trehalose 6-phosphate synthase/phosphatase
VGWTGVRGKLTAAQLESLKLPANLLPVQASQELVARYYDHFSNRILWPGMHSIVLPVRATEADWNAYVEINERFAEAIVSVIKPDDVVWVHDFHLMLVPACLRKAGVTNRIGYFAHTPFPPDPPLVLGLPHAKDMLRSLCQVDVLGLQTRRDVDAFWTIFDAAKLPQRPGVVRDFPIGIDYDMYTQTARGPKVQARVKKLRQSIEGKTVIGSISRLDYTKGILEQLKAVELFLTRQPQPEKFVYELGVAPSREQAPEQRKLRDDIAKEVDRINERLGTPDWQPVHYLYENQGLEAMAAAFQVTDIMLLTPRIDGMNLIAKEFVAAHTDDPGALVISKAMGTAVQFTRAIQVDPNDIENIVRGLEKAVHMPAAERAERWQHMLEVVRGKDVYWWAESFVRALHRSKK